MTHLQEVILMIAKDIDELLKSNNIPYYLDGGTALGAVRHSGFIPWDDDYDIIILPEHYQKFVEVCRTKLDKEKYCFEEAFNDWPMHISKIKLRNTEIVEVDAFNSDNKGIYIDIFCFDNGSDNSFLRYKQYIFGRIMVMTMLASKGYTASSLKKKIALQIGRILSWKPVFNFIKKQTKTDRRTNHLAMTWARTRKNWKQYFCKRSDFEYSIPIIFEDTKLPICQGYDNYLKTCFGNYMQLPPIEKRKGLHIISVNFGKY